VGQYGSVANGTGEPGEVRVPGAVITIDPYRGRNRVLAWLWITVQVPVRGGAWSPLDKVDIVIWDESKRTVLFREGPHSAREAARRKAEVLAEVEAEGVGEFLRSQQVAESRIGPVSVQVPRASPTRYVVASIRRWFS